MSYGYSRPVTFALPALMNYLQERRFRLASLTTRHATLEDVFVNLTGRQLRDAD